MLARLARLGRSIGSSGTLPSHAAAAASQLEGLAALRPSAMAGLLLSQNPACCLRFASSKSDDTPADGADAATASSSSSSSPAFRTPAGSKDWRSWIDTKLDSKGGHGVFGVARRP